MKEKKAPYAIGVSPNITYAPVPQHSSVSCQQLPLSHDLLISNHYYYAVNQRYIGSVELEG